MIQATRPFISVEIAKGAKWSEMIGGSMHLVKPVEPMRVLELIERKPD